MWAIANTKRLVNISLPPDVELGAELDASIGSAPGIRRPGWDQSADGARLPQPGISKIG
jgi:hypothetical protein